MKYSKYIGIIRVLAVLAFFLMAFGLINKEHFLSTASIILGIVLFGGSFIIAVDKLKCQHCGKRIPETLTLKFRRCPHCGEKVE